MYGPYAENEKDVIKLSNNGCTAVLNLMTEKEMKIINYDYFKTMKLC